MAITSRPAAETDKDFCRQVHHLAFRDMVERQFGPWDEQQQDRFFDDDWGVLPLEIVMANGQPVGYYSCKVLQDHYDIGLICILPAFQGQGIGTELITRVQQQAKQQELPVILGVFKENKAQELYRRLGFRQTGESETQLQMEWTSSL